MTINPDGRWSEGVTPSGSGCQPPASAAEEASSQSGIPNAALNTDRELWREADDYYSPSIHVTERGGIGINVGGTVIVRTLREWHGSAPAPLPNSRPLRMCGYCYTWNSKPCGEQCGFSLSDPTFEMLEKRECGNQASADTHPKGGDVKQAPLVSGAVPHEDEADAQSPTP